MNLKIMSLKMMNLKIVVWIALGILFTAQGRSAPTSPDLFQAEFSKRMLMVKNADTTREMEKAATDLAQYVESTHTALQKEVNQTLKDTKLKEAYRQSQKAFEDFCKKDALFRQQLSQSKGNGSISEVDALLTRTELLKARVQMLQALIAPESTK